MKMFLQICGGVFAGLWFWHWWSARPARAAETKLADNAGSGGAGGSGGSGAGGTGGAGGSGDVGAGYGDLAAAIRALAAGVALPNIQTATLRAASAGTSELVAGVGGRRVCVLAVSAMAPGARSIDFRTGDVMAWRMDLDAPAGNSGANLATSWPGYLFAGNLGENLNVVLSGSAVISVTYWSEAG